MKKTHIYAALFTAAIIPLRAANDLTNALNSYTGTSQDNGNGAGQPAFLTDAPASGLEVSKLAAGFTPTGAFETIFFNNTSAISPEFPGAKFGGNRTGNDGSNFLRTVETDYNTKDFTAYVTVRRPAPVSPSTARRSVFFGLGTGAREAATGPDKATSNASVFLELQNGFGNASRRLIGDPVPPATTNQDSEFNWEALTTVSNDAIRIRMVYNSVASTVQYALDYSYDGVTFVPDQLIDEENNLALDTPVQKQAREWASGDRASIYFGGDRSVVFTDLVIDVTDPATPPTPTGLTLAAVASQKVSLQWTTPVAIPGTTYSVYRSTTAGVFIDPAIATGLTTASYMDTTAVNGTPYYYRVTQSNTVAIAQESAPSNEITATPVSGAITPSGVIAVNGGKNALVVDWSDLLSPFETYTVRRSTVEAGPFTVTPGGSGLTASRFLDTNVTDGTNYYYTVTSTFEGSESLQTAPVSASSKSLEVFVDFNNGDTPTISGPGALSSTPLGTSWNGINTLANVANLSDSSANLSSVGFTPTAQGIFSKANGLNVGGDNTTPGSATLTEAGGLNLMLDYVFQNNASTVTYTLTGLVPDRKYDLYLYGYGDALGQNTLFGVNGIFRQTSNPAGLTTLTDGRHYVAFSALAEENGTLTFTWRNGFGATDADASTGSGIINGFQLVENEAAILQPASLMASSNSTGVTLTWNDVEGATDYRIYRSTTRASGYTLIGTRGANPNFVDTTGVVGTTYYYVVTGINTTAPTIRESFLSTEVSGAKEPLILDTDMDGLSDADEALLGTNPNSATEFFVTKSSTVTSSEVGYNIAISMNGAPGTYVIERSTTLLPGSWTEIPSSQQIHNWTTGTVLTNTLNLTATAVAPAPGGKEFFRAKGVTPVPAP